jgi:hypothetical protein
MKENTTLICLFPSSGEGRQTPTLLGPLERANLSRWIYVQKIENKSQRIQVVPRHIHHTKRNVPPGPYKQSAAPPRRYQVSWATPWQETYLAQTHFRKTETTRNRPLQNVLVTRTQVKTLHKQQTAHI